MNKLGENHYTEIILTRLLNPLLVLYYTRFLYRNFPNKTLSLSFLCVLFLRIESGKLK